MAYSLLSQVPMMQMARPLGQVHGRGRPIAQGLMQPFPVVKAKIPCQTLARVPHALVVLQIDLLIFDTPPQTLHKHVVQGPPAAIHADPNAAVLEALGKGRTRELGSLIGI